MAKQLPRDFREFLRLLAENEVEYLLIGGYAVSYHGYPRSTYDMDIWTGISESNAENMVKVMESFGFKKGKIAPEIFLSADCLIRLGVPPVRLEILTSISGVDFETCFQNRIVDVIDEIEVNIINLEDLRKNKTASARHKDLNDLENLPR